MNEDLKNEILQLISNLVDDPDASVAATINQLSDIVVACTKGVDNITAQGIENIQKEKE